MNEGEIEEVLTNVDAALAEIRPAIQNLNVYEFGLVVGNLMGMWLACQPTGVRKAARKGLGKFVDLAVTRASAELSRSGMNVDEVWDAWARQKDKH